MTSVRFDFECSFIWWPGFDACHVMLGTRVEQEIFYAMGCRTCTSQVCAWTHDLYAAGHFPWPIAREIIEPGRLHARPDRLAPLRDELQRCVTQATYFPDEQPTTRSVPL